MLLLLLMMMMSTSCRVAPVQAHTSQERTRWWMDWKELKWIEKYYSINSLKFKLSFMWNVFRFCNVNIWAEQSRQACLSKSQLAELFRELLPFGKNEGGSLDLVRFPCRKEVRRGACLVWTMLFFDQMPSFCAKAPSATPESSGTLTPNTLDRAYFFITTKPRPYMGLAPNPQTFKTQHG